jgi:hypothetical protein
VLVWRQQQQTPPHPTYSGSAAPFPPPCPLLVRRPSSTHMHDCSAHIHDLHACVLCAVAAQQAASAKAWCHCHNTDRRSVCVAMQGCQVWPGPPARALLLVVRGGAAIGLSFGRPVHGLLLLAPARTLPQEGRRGSLCACAPTLPTRTHSPCNDDDGDGGPHDGCFNHVVSTVYMACIKRRGAPLLQRGLPHRKRHRTWLTMC